MGEYFSWLNVDKKEYITPGNFDLGQKLYETAFAGNVFLGALYDLLSSDWKGDFIIFFGDETKIPEDEVNPLIRRIYEECKAWDDSCFIGDYIDAKYKCIDGLYKATEVQVRKEIEYMIREKDFSYNLFKVDPSDPYNGLFTREPKHFRYMINHSKKEFFDIENTALRYTDRDGKLNTRINPLPLLMAYSDNHRDDGCGKWIGDSIEVSNDAPSADYKDMSSIYRYD